MPEQHLDRVILTVPCERCPSPARRLLSPSQSSLPSSSQALHPSQEAKAFYSAGHLCKIAVTRLDTDSAIGDSPDSCPVHLEECRVCGAV